MCTEIKNWINKKIYEDLNRGNDPWNYFDNEFNEEKLSAITTAFNWEQISWQKFNEILSEKREAWNNSYDAPILSDARPSETITFPNDPESNWQKYKRKLKNNHWIKNDIDNLERSVWRILEKLKKDRNEVAQIKGLVIGQVQSGKTANFAGLMALAADNGWNLFIILSGVIENLRNQTQERLLDDLYDNRQTQWCSLPKIPHFNQNEDYVPNRLLLGDNDNRRYVTVCLKNSTRLRRLRNWLWYNPDVARNMRIIIIDDEADQASINTLVDEHEATAINRLIREIVHGGEYDVRNNTYLPPRINGIRREHLTEYGAMNYIGYTATPYANILNETGETTLYPRNFICTLKPSEYYFGTDRIFGEPHTDAIDLWREVPTVINDNQDNDLEYINNIHQGNLSDIPKSLKEAISWYLCCASSFRIMNFTKPSSMLIHTSQRIIHHTNLRLAIENWLRNERQEVAEYCKAVWITETTRLTKDKFIEQINNIENFPPYPGDVNDYPDYIRIEPIINELLNNISYIRMGDNEDFIHHNGIHICEDNSEANYNADDGFYMRLIYPPKNRRTFSNAFIVIGGNTLSRGLTLEGLVSSYFLRTSTSNIDTLTQMGRWFGFRIGYELYPRIWLTNITYNDFQIIALSEKSMRDEIEQYAISRQFEPINFSPRILTHPDSRLNPTAINRMHDAQIVNVDYSGEIIQTTLFNNNITELKQNRITVEEFLRTLNNNPEKKGKDEKNKLWRNIPGNVIRNLFSRYSFNKDSRKFSEVERMIEWLEDCENNGTLENWNVALCGSNPNNISWTITDSLSVDKTNFNPDRYPTKYNYFSFRRFREHRDLLIDTNIYDQTKSIKMIKTDIFRNRIESGLERVPLLLIYCVNGKYGKLIELNLEEDFVGFSILFPGVQGQGTYIAAPVDEVEVYDEFDIEDGGQDD